MIFSMFSNGFIPRSFMISHDTENLGSFISNQPLLQYFNAFSTIPIKIVTSLFNEIDSEGNASTNSRSSDNTKNTSNTSSEFSLSANPNNAGGGKGQINLASRLNVTHGHAERWLSGSFLKYVNYLEGLICCRSTADVLMVLLLVMFILMPRSKIDDYKQIFALE